MRTDPVELRILRSELLDAHRELMRLRTQTEQVVASNRDLTGQLGASSQRLGDMMKVVVAFQQLLDARCMRSAWRSIEDILVNVVGTENFVILQLTESDDLAVIAGQGPAHTQALVAPPTLKQVDAGSSRVVPLKIAEALVAVVVIVDLLPHRDALNASDDEVLELLSRFAASAVMMAEQQRSWSRLTPQSAW